MLSCPCHYGVAELNIHRQEMADASCICCCSGSRSSLLLFGLVRGPLTYNKTMIGIGTRQDPVPLPPSPVSLSFSALWPLNSPPTGTGCVSVTCDLAKMQGLDLFESVIDPSAGHRIRQGLMNCRRVPGGCSTNCLPLQCTAATTMVRARARDISYVERLPKNFATAILMCAAPLLCWPLASAGRPARLCCARAATATATLPVHHACLPTADARRRYLLPRWADECSDRVFPGGVSFSSWAGEGHDATWVSSVNTLEILERLEQPPNLTMGEWDGLDGTTVEAVLTHVGTSSFRTSTTVWNKQGEVFARVRSVGVSVDRANHRPQPLLRRDELAAHVVPEPALAAPTGKGQRPADAYVWSTAVRQTDCDNLGHLNNTKYASYAEEALGFASHSGAFCEQNSSFLIQHSSFLYEIHHFKSTIHHF